MRHFALAAGLLSVPAMVSIAENRPQTMVDSHDPRLQLIQKYFADRDCPLQHSAAEFLIASDQNELDWRLLPSISMVESSGGKDFRNNNVFGWDSAREKFSSITAGIHFVAAKLGRSKLYKDKSLDTKLRTYNPRPDYPARVKSVMRALGTAQLRPAIN